jgi:hypothetical protein
LPFSDEAQPALHEKGVWNLACCGFDYRYLLAVGFQTPFLCKAGAAEHLRQHASLLIFINTGGTARNRQRELRMLFSS